MILLEIVLTAVGLVAVVPWVLQELGAPLGVPPQSAWNAAMFGIGWLCAAGLISMTLTASRLLDYKEPKFPLAIIVFIIFALFVLAGVTAGEFKLANAAITVLLGGIVLLLLSTALEVIFAAVRMFLEGHRIEVQSQWGGLGGGLGGWQISQLAGMVLLAAMLIAGSLGALVAVRGNAAISATEPKPKSGTAPAPDSKPGGDTNPAGKTNSKSG
jgi:hypothetical protein